jgi:hypothetical protein
VRLGPFVCHPLWNSQRTTPPARRGRALHRRYKTVSKYENAARPGFRGRQARRAECTLHAPPARGRRFRAG